MKSPFVRRLWSTLASLWRGRQSTLPAISPSPTFSPVRRADLIGRRLLSIRGYQQPQVEDLSEDDSAWWLEFEGDAWLHISFAIAPAFVSPQFFLRYEAVGSPGFPLAYSPLAFIANPPEVASLIGLCLLAELPDQDDGFQQLDRRLGFGQSPNGPIESVVRFGYLEPGKGLSARISS